MDAGNLIGFRLKCTQKKHPIADPMGDSAMTIIPFLSRLFRREVSKDLIEVQVLLLQV